MSENTKPFTPDPNEIGALWQKEGKPGPDGKPTTYLSGTINGERVVIFKTKRPKFKDTAPDYRVLRAIIPGQAAAAPAAKSTPVPAAKKPVAKPAPAPAPAEDDDAPMF